MKYAQHTTVSVDKSRAEIEKILSRYGAEQFVYGWNQDMAVIAFLMKGRMIRFQLKLPSKNDDQFIYTPAKKRKRRPEEALKAWEQACRQKWRALVLVIKAKLEAIDSGITTFEDEFLAHIVLPDGSTAGEFLKPQIALAYEKRQMPKLLPFTQ